MVDYKALVGDNSDNIKGVPGIGPKTATEMLKEFGTLEKLFEALPENEKLEKRLGPFRKEAEFSKWLVILERHVPVEIPDLEGLALHENQDSISAYFKTLGSDTLQRRLEGREEPAKTPKAKKIKTPLPPAREKPSPQGSLF
jgi:DNA polymerase-1